jgi:hypothetical protein
LMRDMTEVSVLLKRVRRGLRRVLYAEAIIAGSTSGESSSRIAYSSCGQCQIEKLY